jgi:CBS domain-containing protein
VIPYANFWEGLCGFHRGKYQYDKAAMQHFRDEIRSARMRAFEDAENFHGIVVALEGLGAFCLGGRKNGFGNYEVPLGQLAANSVLFEDASTASDLHLSFADLFRIVREGRNDAVHEGVYARNLADHAVQLALIIEDALSMSADQVKHFMVRGVITAEEFHPLSFVRQQMIQHSFSFLPLYRDGTWRFLSDRELAMYLRTTSADRKERLCETVGHSVGQGNIKLIAATCVNPEDPVDQMLDKLRTEPLLVVAPSAPGQLLGIVTTFDLL